MSTSELYLISKVINDGDLAVPVKSGLKPQHLPGEWEDIWRWILDYHRQHGATPTARVFANQYGDISLYDNDETDNEPYTALLDEIFGAYRKRCLLDGLQPAISSLNDDDVDAAFSALTQALQKASVESARMRDIDIIQNWENRILRYEEMRNTPNALRGIPTGFTGLDRITHGLRPQQFIVFAGEPKRGKSLFLLIVANAAHIHGKRPLFVSFEMSIEEQEARYDSIISQVPYDRILSGQLSSQDMLKIKKSLILRKNMQPFVFTEDSNSLTTVTALGNKIQEYNPDVLFVDGVYLMDDEEGEQKGSPQALTNITRSMKRLAQRFDIPVVATTQVLPWKVGNKKTRAVTADAIGYCVDEETEILTRRGWLRYTDLLVGDIALTLNHVTGMSEWQPVREVCVFSSTNRDMILIEGKNHSSLTTPNHRWPSVVKQRNGEERRWVTTETMRYNDRIPTAAPSVLPTTPVFSNEFVELVGWFYTEGSIQNYDSVVITQCAHTNPDNVIRIQKCLEYVYKEQGASTWRRLDRKSPRTSVDFWISSQQTRKTLLQVAPNRIPSTEFLNMLTQEQLDLFIEVSMLADNSGPGSFHQKIKKRRDSFAYACILAGIPISYRDRAPSSSTPYVMYGVRLRTRNVVTPSASRTVAGSYRWERITGYTGDVWCPVTDNQSWFARRNGSTYFTGNTSSFAQDADLILGVERNPDIDDQAIIRVVLARSSPTGEVHVQWDWSTMEFEEIFDSGYVDPSFD